MYERAGNQRLGKGCLHRDSTCHRQVSNRKAEFYYFSRDPERAQRCLTREISKDSQLVGNSKKHQTVSNREAMTSEHISCQNNQVSYEATSHSVAEVGLYQYEEALRSCLRPAVLRQTLDLLSVWLANAKE